MIIWSSFWKFGGTGCGGCPANEGGYDTRQSPVPDAARSVARQLAFQDAQPAVTANRGTQAFERVAAGFGVAQAEPEGA
jgi:hypothetical protein